MKKEFLKKGVDFIPIPLKTKCEFSPKIIFSFLKLDALLKEKDINLIHANTRVTSVLAYLLSRKWKIPYLSTCHGFFKPRLSRRIFPLWGERTIAISDQVRQHLLNDFKLKQYRVKLIYNGIDSENKLISEQEKKAAQQRFGLKDSPTIGIIARLSDVKGHRFLIQAMGEVIKVYPQAQLMIVGEGKEKRNLINLSRDLGITEHILFIRAVEDISQALAAIDIFVMPSLQEGLGLSIMEAMARGIGVIASDVGGIRNLIKHGSNGILVAPQDIQAISSSIIALLDDKAKLKDYGLKARQTIEERFLLERMVLETEGVYSECLNAKL